MCTSWLQLLYLCLSAFSHVSALGWSDVKKEAKQIPVVGKSLNILTVTDTCKFGKPIKGSCDCDKEGDDPVCGSDSETYRNDCFFKCALNCNPLLLKSTGSCNKLRARLNFSKKEKPREQNNGNQDRTIGGSDYDFMSWLPPKYVQVQDDELNYDYGDFAQAKLGKDRFMAGVSADEFLIPH